MLKRDRIMKIAAVSAAALLALSAAACGRQKAQEHVFRAVITEMEEGSMLVTPEEGAEEARSSDAFRIPTAHMDPSPEPKAGDVVEITYTGGIQETYPAGLEKVLGIRVVESVSEEVSILRFGNDEGAARLEEDMKAGRIPAKCRACYDEMGARPEVTVTDPDRITDLYDRLSCMVVGKKSEISVTDSYHYIVFTLQDGTDVGWSFEGRGLLCAGRENYEVRDRGGLWDLVRLLQEEEMEGEEGPDAGQAKTALVAGPYGQISLTVPDVWTWQACGVDEEGLTYGLYGLILRPEDALDGQIEVFCSDSFGVCGTGLAEKEISLAGDQAIVGTYDGHPYWDFIIFGKGEPSLVAQHTDCSAWTGEMWEEALTILDTVRFDPSLAEGGIGRYLPESESDEAAVSMWVDHVTPTGLTVRFRQYDGDAAKELLFGEAYTLEKKKGDAWEMVPVLEENGAFTDIGYSIPAEGEAEQEIDWEWLYGKLSPGAYRIRKTVTGGGKNYELYAGFLLV